MLGAFLHRALRYWLFKVPARNIAQMALFSMVDIPFIATVGLKQTLNTVSNLRTLRRNLKSTQWAGIAELYPRPVVWFYTYILFGWGRYCQVLSTLTNDPERSLIGEVFLRYCCQIDDVLDSHPHKEVLVNQPAAIKRDPRIQAVARELCDRLAQTHLPQAAKMAVLRLIVRFRANALSAMQNAIHHPDAPLADVIRDKEQTAGNLLRTWIQILNILYDVPEPAASGAEILFFNLSMIAQCLDDLGDIPEDHAEGTQNLFMAITRQYPAEWLQLKAHLTAQTELFLDWHWAKSHIPNSTAEIQRLYACYAENMLKEQTNPPLAQEFYQTMEKIRIMGSHPANAVAKSP